MEEDGEVHAHLKEAADPELHGSLSQQEVACLESVSTGPHQHHLNAGGTGSERELESESVIKVWRCEKENWYERTGKCRMSYA